MANFYERVMPYAVKAGKQLGIDPAVVASWWAWETAEGTNLGYRKYNNFAGIKYTPSGKGYIEKYKPTDSAHAGYASESDFVKDYVRVMELSYYEKTLLLARSGSSLREVTKALNDSPYAVDDYNINAVEKYYQRAVNYLSGNSWVDNSSLDVSELEKRLTDENIGKYALIGVGVVTLAGIVGLISD